ncbi:MAG: hypothetical protein JWQ64_2891 [Subtercola sp.]|nr:hypothetical protein [Subtercola sp.]
MLPGAAAHPGVPPSAAARPGDAAGADARAEVAPHADMRSAVPPSADLRRGVTPSAAARPGTHLTAERGRSRLVLPVAVIVVAVLVLGALFLLGTRLPGILSAAPVATPTPTQTPTPTPTPTPTSTAGPQLAGTYEWSALRGGECISPFTSVWQQRFTVIDCAVPHAAQVMSRGTLGDDPAAVYPGQDAIKEQLNLLCQLPANFNPAILAAYPDVVWQADFPVSAAQWQSGLRDYYCFVSRSSSLPITGNFAPAAFSG